MPNKVQRALQVFTGGNRRPARVEVDPQALKQQQQQQQQQVVASNEMHSQWVQFNEWVRRGFSEKDGTSSTTLSKQPPVTKRLKKARSSIDSSSHSGNGHEDKTLRSAYSTDTAPLSSASSASSSSSGALLHKPASTTTTKAEKKPAKPAAKAAAPASNNVLRERRQDATHAMLGLTPLDPRFVREYELVREIGVGAFGFVLMARQRSTGQLVAVKFIVRACLPEGSLVRDPVHEYNSDNGEDTPVPLELAVIRSLSHTNIIRYVDSFSDATYFYLVTELHGSTWTPTSYLDHLRHKPMGNEPLASSIHRTTAGSEHQARHQSTASLDKLSGRVVFEPATSSATTNNCSSNPKSSSPIPLATVFAASRRHRRASLPASMFSATNSPAEAHYQPPAQVSQPSNLRRPMSMMQLSQHANGTTAALPLSATADRDRFFEYPLDNDENDSGDSTTTSSSSRCHTPSDPSFQVFLPQTMRRTYTHDLFDCIEHYRRLPETLARHIFAQLVSAVAHMHSMNLCHGDIKDENILIDRQFNVRLIDFGACTLRNQTMRLKDFTGTIHYAAPEVLDGTPFDPAAAEIWTLGVLLYTMVAGSTPFGSLQQTMLGVFSRPRGVTASCTDLISRMLHPTASYRATIDTIRAHPWMSA